MESKRHPITDTLRIATLLIVVAAVIAVWRYPGRGYSESTAGFTDQERAAGLDHRLTNIHLDGVRYEDAACALEKWGKVKLECPPSNLRAYVNVDDGTVDDALQQLVDCLDADYRLVDRVILIIPSAALGKTVRIYDVSDLTGINSPQSVPQDWYIHVYGVLNGRTDTTQFIFDGTQINQVGRKIAVITTSARHRSISRLLAAIRRATPDGKGEEDFRRPLLIRLRPGSFVLRIYDVRDLVPPLMRLWQSGRTAPDQMQNRLKRGLIESILQRPRDLASLSQLDVSFEIGGRLVVEAPPQTQERVSQALKELRQELE